MIMKTKKYFAASVVLILAFAVFTILVATVDVDPIGPEGSAVGFSALNQFLFRYVGTHSFWFSLTEWLGVAAIFIMLCFGAEGMFQLLRRKSIRRVDAHILLLGGLYALLIAVYAFFEVVVINYRPVLVDGCLEPSYPSTHTMLVICVAVSASMRLRAKFPEKKLLWTGGYAAAGILSVGTAVGRFLSGVHWFTDIVGAVLLSAALLVLYRFGIELFSIKK